MLYKEATCSYIGGILMQNDLTISYESQILSTAKIIMQPTIWSYYQQSNNPLLNIMVTLFVTI